MSDFRQLAQDIGAAPLGDLIAAVGRGVAEAQAALDAGSLEETLALYDQSDEAAQTLRDLGYRPTFYTIPETEGELKLSMTVAGTGSVAPPAGRRSTVDVPQSPADRLTKQLVPKSRVYAAPVDGRYQNSYSYNSQVGATVKFKVVAVPPPSEAESSRVVPNLVGMTLAEAVALAERFDLVVEPDPASPLQDDTTLTDQSIPPAEIVIEGTVIQVSG
jgi:hypothetical protein